MMGYYNPAVAGSMPQMRVAAMAKMQWAGITNAPSSFVVLGDMPMKVLGNTAGLGLSLFNEAIGLYNNTTVGVQLSLPIKLAGGVLSVGIQPGLFNQTWRGTDVKIPESDKTDPNDPAIPTTDLEAMAFDFGMGLYYLRGPLYVAASSMHVLEQTVMLDENIETYVARSYYFASGYNIPIRGTLFEVEPSVMVMSTILETSCNVQAQLVYNKLFSGGLNWRIGSAACLFLGAKLGKFRVGYAYDLPTNELLRGTAGSHEVFLRYEVDVKLDKNKNKRYKSVRIL